MTRRLLLHVAVPAAAPAALVALAVTPVELIGCANRGIAALAVTGLSTLCALATAQRGLAAARQREPGHAWWTLSTLIFVLPLPILLALA